MCFKAAFHWNLDVGMMSCYRCKSENQWDKLTDVLNVQAIISSTSS